MNRTILAAGQNLTEGPPTDFLRRADIITTQETRPWRLRRGLPGKRHHIHPRDRHQAISWGPVYTVTDRGYARFHRSGRAEGWKFRTPARGALWTTGHLFGDPDLKLAVIDMWWLNSWGKDNAEGPARKAVIEERTIPVVDRLLNRLHREDYTVLMQGDTNNIRWSGLMPNMWRVAATGLDRMWVTRGGILTPTGPLLHGPETGVGSDRRHRAIGQRFEVSA